MTTTFMTSINRKKTFTGLYTKWDSFTPPKYKINLIRTLTYHCYGICSSSVLLQSALDELRKFHLQNGHAQGTITFRINDAINRNMNESNNHVSTVPKTDIIILLPYLGLTQVYIATKSLNELKSCVYNFYSCVNPLKRPIANLDALRTVKTNAANFVLHLKLPIVVKGFFKDLVSAGTA